MIDKKALESVVNEWLNKTNYFLVDLNVSADGNIMVVIDHAEGVWIEDCAELSRFIESRFDRELEDFGLEVGSAGLGQPFKVRRQWEIHIGKQVETMLKDGKKFKGTLTSVADDTFAMEVETKIKPEGAKRPRIETVTMTFPFADIAYTKYLIKTK